MSAALGVCHSHIFACLIKGPTDKKLILFNGNMNYKDMIYYILFLFIILTYSMKNFSPQLKL